MHPRNRALSSCVFALVAVGALLSARTAPGQEPSFELVWDAPGRVSGSPSTPVPAAAMGLLVINGLDDVEDGVQGWSLSLAAENAAIVDITTEGTVGAEVDADPPGLRKGGFEKTELTLGEGNEGAVSAIVLAFTEPIFLRSAQSPAPIVNVTIEASTPPETGDCTTARVGFVDGRRGSGQPVDNKVTYRGQTYRPTKGVATVDFCAAADCCSAPLNLIIQEENSLETTDLFAGDVRPACNDHSAEGRTIEVPTPIGETGETKVYAGIVSQLDVTQSGVQGWSLAVGISGDIDFTDVTVAGTATELLFDGGFNKTELVDPEVIHPETGQPQGRGAVSAVVLSFTQPVTLGRVGTATVLAMGVTALEEQDEGDIVGEIEWFEFLRGSGQPVRVVATVSGQTREFCERQGAQVRFVQRVEAFFSRCDPNNDGKSDIADPIWIVNELFRGGPAAVCPKSTDCNDDGQVDLSDATYGITYQFLGGETPLPPFPSCGVDPTEDSLPCDGDVTVCP